VRGVLELRAGTTDDVEEVVAVWRAAQGARGQRPAASRIARVVDKLTAPDALLVVGELEDDDGATQVAGFALGEPGRADDGTGDVEAELLHVTMLSVTPGAQRQGLGSALVEALADAAWPLGYRRLHVWTRTDNTPAHGLYEACGLELSGREQDLAGPVVQYVAELEPPVRDVVVTGQGLRLGQLLKLAGLVDTGAQAKELLAASGVQVDGEVELRRGRQLVDDEVVTARDQSVRLIVDAPPPT